MTEFQATEIICKFSCEDIFFIIENYFKRESTTVYYPYEHISVTFVKNDLYILYLAPYNGVYLFFKELIKLAKLLKNRALI